MAVINLKPIVVILVVSCLCMIMIAFTCINTGQQKDGYKSITGINGFAVVELFTSEGCSSCPAADELVAKIQKEDNGQPVYILAYHVDYWDRLGWKDVFGSAAYAKRQNQYADWLKLKSIYTPQIVINGTKEFVGSQENTLRSTIKNNLHKTQNIKLTLSNLQVTQEKVNLQYQTENLVGNNISLVLATVQKWAVTNVKSGENGGRKLSHVQIVRNLQTVSLNGTTNGKAEIDFPADLNADGLVIIAFLQNNTSGEIIAGDKVELKK